MTKTRAVEKDPVTLGGADPEIPADAMEKCLSSIMIFDNRPFRAELVAEGRNMGLRHVSVMMNLKEIN